MEGVYGMCILLIWVGTRDDNYGWMVGSRWRIAFVIDAVGPRRELSWVLSR